MTPLSPDSEEARRLLLGYLLDTLRPSEHKRVDGYLSGTPAWQEALEEEKKNLGDLDRLPAMEPSRDLTAGVMERVSKAEEAPVELERTLRTRPILAYAVAAVVVCLLLMILPTRMATYREAARRASVANNLKQWGIAFKMYANVNNGLFPPVTRYDDMWFPDIERLWPHFVSDPSLLINPRLPNSGELRSRLAELLEADPVDWEAVTRLAASSFAYSGWNIQEDAEAERLQTQRRLIARADYSEDISDADGTIARLQEGLERFMTTDINNPAATTAGQSEIPVMFENVYSVRSRELKGAHVLYMDGHVEFVEYGEAFPVTDAVAEAFRPPED